MTNAELIKALRYCADNEKEDGCDECPYLHNGMCRTMLSDAAYVLEAAEKRIAELMPKEGEWLRTDAFPHRIYCSVCYKTYVPNDRWQIWVDDELPKNFCPNCGARMKGERYAKA